ncbi:hypothetical protein R3W88_014329 [Solanum pinnatisectum]|uniref:Transmembrane protein n=1 Tax=Solanum pinnatisectum TaxID=50273 RepID=A0AAV9KRA9_9SOLN|nr:hypothetical protein R3W88_014329 [Solanum pinnatisectum]
MAPKIIVLALVFFSMVCLASAIDDSTAATLKDAANAPIPVKNNNIIGTINGSDDNEAVAAAPVGGPISGVTFPDISLPPTPNGATTSTLDFTTIATIIVAVSFFF